MIGLLLARLLLPLPACAQAPEGAAQEAVARARAQRLSEDPYWFVLLHYRRRIWGGARSEADGPRFFLSPKGKEDPAAELEATVRSFFEPPYPDEERTQHPQCRFPARYAWLKSRLGFSPDAPPEQPCPRFKEWAEGVGGSSMTVIFADAFLSNPSSMYGHTFLRLDNPEHSDDQRLLDYTINFSATADTENGILFAIKGLLGGYPGNYSTTPYYMKTQEYNNMESRDLWEYRLTLGRPQIDRLLAHAWEMGTTYFDYYFFTKNCSYQPLWLLDAAEPSLRLTAWPRWGVIPSDTVRWLLAHPGLVSGVRYRPSHVSSMLSRRALLSSEERALAEGLARGSVPSNAAPLSSLPEPRQAAVLDSAFDLFRFETGFHAEYAPRIQDRERALLVQRGRLKIPSPPAPQTPREKPPEAGHFTARAALGAGATKDFAFEELSIRPTLHDLLDPAPGYVPYSQQELGHVRLRFDDKDSRAYLEQARLIDIVSLTPWDSWIRKPSWKISTSLEQAHELGSSPTRGLYYDLNAGSGLSKEFSSPLKTLAYALAEADLGAGGILRQGYRAGGGASAGLIVEPAPAWRLRAEARLLRYGAGDRRENASLRLGQSLSLSKDFSVRLDLIRSPPYREAALTLLTYF